jgi:hypothetical protein
MSSALPFAPGAHSGQAIPFTAVPMAEAPRALNSVEDIERLSRPVLRVWSPSLEHERCEVGGHHYEWEPESVCEVSDHYTYPMVETAQGVRPNYGVRNISMRASEIVKFIVSSDGRGLKGFCVLMGDGRDEQRKAEARRKYIDWRVAHSKTVQALWLSQVQAAVEAPGGIAPVQPKHVRRELEFLRQYESGALDRKAFVCKIDGFESDSYDDVARYVAQMYPGQPVEPNIQSIGAGPAPAKPAAPVAPKAKDSEEGVFLLERAGELKVELSVGDQKGLRFGDPDVITDVTARLVAAEKKGSGKKAAAGG